MALPPPPRESDPFVQALRWFVLVVALAPMLCCGSCLAWGVLTALFSQPPPVAPAQTGPARPDDGKNP